MHTAYCVHGHLASVGLASGSLKGVFLIILKHYVYMYNGSEICNYYVNHLLKKGFRKGNTPLKEGHV